MHFNIFQFAKNGSKMYYKRVGGKWKRISNTLGMKVEKGKMKYSYRPDSIAISIISES